MYSELFSTLGKLNPRPPTRPDVGRHGKRRSMLQRASRPIVEAIESRLMLSASLLKDINATYGDASPSGFATSSNVLYFTANDGVHGTQEWQTDGTAAGTTPAVSLVPGAPQAMMSDITIDQGLVYFFAQGPSDGNSIGLYQSTGNPASTTELGRFQQPGNLTYLSGLLYFTVSNGAGSTQIWDSGGAAWNTQYLVTAPAVSYLTGGNGELYFLDGTTLWKSNGTQAGTVAVASVASNAVNTIQGMTSVNGRVYIINSGELWTSDGTAAGTTILSYGSGAFVTDVSAMANYNGALYVLTDSRGEALWKTDGTPQGTVLVDTISTSGTDVNPSAMEVVNGVLYFDAVDPSHGDELWRSDGTAAGTQLVADINPGPANGFSFPQEPAGSTYAGPFIGQFNGIVYFGGTDRLHGVQLWRSDGTAAGTYQVDQINSNTNDSDPYASLTIGGTMYFTANDGVHGYELWKSDGTAGGTTIVADLNPGAGSSDPQYLVNFNGTLYFTAFDGTKTNLYKTDGTAAGTSLVFAGGVGPLTPVGNSLYFEAIDSSGNDDLYRTDGTASGTKFIQLLMPPLDFPFLGIAPAEPSLDAFDGTLYFTAPGGFGPTTLWKVNPDASTTAIDSFPGGSVEQANLTVVDNALYFAANDINGNCAIWRTDGTSAGTYMVRTTGSRQYVVDNFRAFDDSLYFTVGGYGPGYSANGIYHTDGTSAGTILLANLSSFGGFTAADGKLYFIASNNNSNINTSLYTTDGTPTGTHVVDPSITNIYSLSPSNNVLYFNGQDSTGQRDLWQTDGTTTSLVDPSEEAAGWQAYDLLGQVDNTFLFSAYDAQHGVELWGVPLTPSATATFAESDTTTSGNWTTFTGGYGADGYAVIGGDTALPSYVTMSTSDASYYQWAPAGQADSRAPQTGPWSSAHEAGTDYAYSSFSVNLNFTEGQSHDVAFYLVDYDRQGRVETVQVTNADSGQVLDSRTVSNFSNGEYLVYSLSGDVKINFINGGPQNAVLSAILFGLGTPYAPTTAFFNGVDTTTQGQWTGVYGSQGYQVLGAGLSGGNGLQGPYDFTVTGSTPAQFFQWATSTTDHRDLQTAPGSSNLVAACFYSYTTPFGYNLKFLDAQTHQVSLYLLDWDYRNRDETITVSNALTGQVLDTENVTNFSQGVYLRWDVSGDVQFNITNTGGLNAVVSGLFIDAPNAARFVKTDSTTMGSYTGVYGLQGYDVINSAQSLPSYASLSFAPSATPFTWAASTTAANALQDSPGSSSRIAACVYSEGPSFSFNLDLTDGKTHQVALYVLDWDSLKRNETIQITDAHSGKLLDSENVSNFANGKYLVWDLSGDVNVTVVNSGGWNEVLSGIFFG